MPDIDTIVTLLRSVELFRATPGNCLLQLAKAATEVRFDANERIIQKGESGDCMYIILSGKAKVHDGEHTVGIMGKGELFGELSLLDSAPRSVSVTSVEPTRLLLIDRSSFFEVLLTSGEVLKGIIALLLERIRNQTASIIEQLRLREIELSELVQEKTKHLEERNSDLALALDQLKTTQTQLIHSEKMASLGELTAGIAHEIKNPLNFVNNFSELISDLTVEASEAIANDNLTIDEKLTDLMDILLVIRDNTRKIQEHGQRADLIIKGMLMHARKPSTEKEIVDINQMLEKDVHLAYHGWRAHDTSFNVRLEQEYEANLPQASVIPQDISRVFINLINNALYAVREKQKGIKQGYHPTVRISTTHRADKIFVHIRDNGTGIPESVKEKIFDPFYTTKPTGEGTGLGLSISYDIVTKGHGGSIRIESEPGEFTEFILTIPVKG